MEKTSSTSKRVWLVAVAALAACVAVLCCAGTAQAKPYGGYKSGTAVYGSGYVSLSTYDERGVAQVKRDPYIWSNNTYLYVNGKQTATSTALKQMKMKGISYNKKKNTLTLKNAKYPKYTLSAVGMGTNFKVKVVGKKNALAAISCSDQSTYDSKGNYKSEYGTGLNITGKGTLTVGKKKYASTPIQVQSDASAVKLVVAKKIKLNVYATGTGNVISVSSTVKKAKKAISLKGKVKTKLQRKSMKYGGYSSYKSDDDVIPVNNDNSYSETIYTTGGKSYIISDNDWDDEDEEYYQLRQVQLIAKGFYARTNTYKNSVSSKELEGYASASGRILYEYGDSMTILNGGSYYGDVSESAVSYFDTSTRRTYYNKWDVYKRVATGTNVYGDKVVYVQKAKTVSNSKDLPKGYKGTVDRTYKTTYTYIVANTSLVKK